MRASGTMQALALAILFGGLACDRGGDATQAPERPASPASADPAPGAEPDAPADASARVEDESDRDGDGIRDRDDRCPELCETLNGVDDDDGCPEDAVPIDPEIQAILGVIPDLAFDINKATIRPSSFATLDRIAAVLLRHPELLVEIQGHRDELPDDRVYASEITQRRAHSVRSYLVDHGVPAENLRAVGYGAERPLEPNRPPEGRARNRRVELVLVDRPATVAEGCTRPPPLHL